MVTTADQQIQMIHGLSHRASFNDLERPQTQISRSDHSVILNIPEMVKDTAIRLFFLNKPFPSLDY